MIRRTTQTSSTRHSLFVAAMLAVGALDTHARSDTVPPCQDPVAERPPQDCQSPPAEEHPDPNDGMKEPKPPTANVLAGIKPIAVAAGFETSLVLAADGTVWRWGWHHWFAAPPPHDGQLTPVQVQGLSNVLAIAAGHNYSMALLKDGTVKTWGSSSVGQLGDGTSIGPQGSHTPVTVMGCAAFGGSTNLQCADDGNEITFQTLDHVVAIAAGESHALALQDNGFVWAWGSSCSGQLGIGSNVPCRGVPYATPVANLSGVRSIAAGVEHSLAVTHLGELYAWGSNGHGQLADGTYERRYRPVLALGANVAAAAGGWNFSAALMSDGTVQAWGANSAGQLGDGQTIFRRPVAAPVGSGSAPLVDVAALAANRGHTLALLADGTVRAWGYNWSGNLGNGGNDTERLPVEVRGLIPIQIPLLAEEFGMTQVAAGMAHSLALDPACNAVWSWGSNLVGALGNGSTDDSNVPTPVMLGGGVFNTSGLLPVRSGCYLLGVTKAGGGRGRVSAGNGVLDCGVDCPRAYARHVRPLLGTPTVTLTATPQFDSRFVGWGEACAAAGASSVAVINVTRSTHCTAIFEADKPSQ